MNERVRKHLEEYNRSEGWGTDDKELETTVREGGKEVYRERLGSHRW
jgi:hypothetical protein